MVCPADKPKRYGLGVYVTQSNLGISYGHGGWCVGYLSHVAYYPVQRVAVAVQVNTDVRDDMLPPLMALTQDVLQTIERADPALIIAFDLADARKNWLKSIKDADKRTEAEQSDFLAYRDRAGLVSDFHYLRHTYISRIRSEGRSRARHNARGVADRSAQEHRDGSGKTAMRTRFTSRRPD
jgi:hypothetical protein